MAKFRMRNAAFAVLDIPLASLPMITLCSQVKSYSLGTTLIACAWTIYRTTALRPNETLREKKPLFDGPIKKLSVRYEISQNGTKTGDDQGALWVEGGVLNFEGLRSKFRLTKKLTSLSCRFRKDQQCTIAYTVEREIKVKLTLFANHPSDFRAQIQAWFGGVLSNEQSVLPPMELAPEYLPVTRYAGVLSLASVSAICIALSLGFLAKPGQLTLPDRALELTCGVASTMATFLFARLYYRRSLVASRMKSKPWLARYCQTQATEG